MSQETKSAGKIYTQTHTAKDCVNPQLEQVPRTSPQIAKFTNTDAGRPEVGTIRHYWRKEEDLVNGRTNPSPITHGVKSIASTAAKHLMNPPLTTSFQDAKLADQEKNYRYSLNMQNRPSGKSAMFIPPVPGNYQNTTFGKKTEKSENAAGTVNPNKSAVEVANEEKMGHKNYVKTHHDYYVGEQINRNYTGDWNKPGTVFGVENPHSNDGRNVSRTLRWPNPESGEFQDRHGPTTIGRKMGATLLVDKRTDNFRARTQPCLGQIHDPIQSTKGIDFAFGLGLKDSTGCGAGDIIHGRSEGNFMLGKDRQRGVLAAVRQHLKKANYHNFKTLQDAFEYYDKNNDKFIDANELRKVAFDFNLPIDDDTLSALMVMSSQGTGKINYTQFINFLNWKDKMPDCPTHDSETNKIIQQIDSSFSHRTSASMINSTVGGLPTENWPAFGVPTVRSDIPAPCIRRVSDRTNYGDELGAYGLLSPSIFTDHGVFESDFFEPRDFSSIKRLFTAIGVEMSDEGWESAWKEALRIQQEKVNRNDQPCDKASVECFRLVLDSVTQTVKDAADVAT